MIQMYFNLVIAGRRTCDVTNKTVTLVPEALRAEVLDMLTKDGRDANGKLI